MNLLTICENAKKATQQVESLTSKQKNEILQEMARSLIDHSEDILAANAIDVKNAQDNNMKEGLVDRLMLDASRLKSISDGLLHIAGLEDPIGSMSQFIHRDNGLQIGKMTVPLGVIAMIYEGRPNVTVDATGLCLKTNNVAILRGSSSALHTNIALVKYLRAALEKFGVDNNAIQLIEETDHNIVNELIKMNGFIDLVIPRGGASLINNVVSNATVPVIETGTGNCHIFVDSSADMDMAIKILINGKTQRVGVCNALESIVVMSDVADEFFKKAIPALLNHNVQIYGCQLSQKYDHILPATEEDFAKEYGDYMISCKIVQSFDEAIHHINSYSTGHSECIVTNDLSHANLFLKRINSACVYVNASTRFSDGGEFGFGAEIGISTQKVHARGPMGLEALTSYKYIIIGNGQIR